MRDNATPRLGRIPGCRCSWCSNVPRSPDLVAGLVVVGCALVAVGLCAWFLGAPW